MIAPPAAGVYQKGKLDIGEIMESVLGRVSDGSVGAVSFFIGVTKREGRGEKEVMMLEMESYVEHANNAIKRICGEVTEKHGLGLVGIWHLLGRFEIGEPVVIVAVAGKSRASVFEGLRETVERYKREPALFKKEVYVDGTHTWLEGA